MPMRFGRALVLAIAGGIALNFAWAALWRLFSFPCWHQLNARGMYVHDIDAIYLIVFGPLPVGLIFLAATLIESWFENRRFENGRPPPRNTLRILFFAVFSATGVFILLNARDPSVWHFPLSEVVAGVVGAGLGACWVGWRRRDESISTAAQRRDVTQTS